MPAGALKSHEQCTLATLKYQSYLRPNISNDKAREAERLENAIWAVSNVLLTCRELTQLEGI